MIHSKAIDVLKTFTKEELKQFSDFIRSPFHNKNKNLIKLFDALEKYHPEFEVENETIYTKVYQDKGFNYDNLKKLMSEKFLILEKFLLQLNMKKDNFTNDKYLLEEYLQRKLNEIFLFKVKKVNEKIDKVNCYINDFYDKFYFEDLIIQFYLENNNQNKIPLESLIKRSEWSLCFFLENLLNDFNDVTTCRRNFNKFNEEFIFESFLKSVDFKIFLKYLSRNKIKNNFMAFQINLILMFMYPKNGVYFERAKFFILNESKHFINVSYKWSNYLNRLHNYCIVEMGKGEKKYELELFEIDNISLKTTFNVDNRLGITSYLNLIRRGLKLNKLAWAEEFINDYTKFLEEEHKQNTYNYAKSLLEFEKHNYEESLNYASKLKIRTSYYDKMQINILILKCYYELSLYDAAFSLIDSSKHYLTKTTELVFEAREHYTRILSIIYKIIKFKVDSNNILKSDLLNLKSEIAAGSIFRIDWYLQKVEELEKSIPLKSLPSKLKKSQKNKKHLKSA